MDYTTWLLFLHVLAGCLLLGHALLVPHLHGALRRAASPSAVRDAAELMRRASQLNPVFAIALLATGVVLGRSSVFSEGWLVLPTAAWLVNSALAARVLRPLGIKIGGAAAVAPDGAVTPELEALRRSRRLDVAANVMAANDLASLFVMVEKPGVVAAAAVFVAAHLVVLLVWRFARRLPAHSPARAVHRP
jgi:hypothetical protein